MFNLMVERSVGRDAVFAALAHHVRREMLDRLAEGDLTVGELARPLSMSLAAASKHVRTLEGAGLVRRTVVGRTHRCRLEPGPLVEALGWLREHERYWERRLDALEELFTTTTAPETTTDPEEGP